MTRYFYVWPSHLNKADVIPWLGLEKGRGKVRVKLVLAPEKRRKRG